MAIPVLDAEQIIQVEGGVMTNTYQELSERIIAWHFARFPNAKCEHVSLKLCTETAEVADAVLSDVGMNGASGKGEVALEAADVVIALTVLLGRWYCNVDLFEEVEKKITILETPGAHKASIKEKK